MITTKKQSGPESPLQLLLNVWNFQLSTIHVYNSF